MRYIVERESVVKRTYFFLHLLIMFYAVGSIFSKRAAGTEFLSWGFIFNYGMVMLILVIYAVFWQLILKKLPLTVAMANKSATVIWGLIFGSILFKEHISLTNIIGAVIIIAGIVIVALADKEQTTDKEQEICM